MNQASRFRDRVAIVTGGASGIGLACARQFIAEGASVVVADINRQRGATVLASLRELGAEDRARLFPCDVSQEVDVIRLIQYTLQEFARLDCMVNNAGTGGAYGPLVDTAVDDWDRTLAVLLRGVFLGTKHASQAMIRQGWGGAVVNIASVAGMNGGTAGAAYSSAKAGVIALTQCTAVQLAPHKIRCNCVSPGTIITPLILRGGDREAMSDAARQTQPWPEVGLPEYVAPVVAFLSSDDARFMTGENLIVDGGMTACGPHLYSGRNPLGNLIAQYMEQAGVTSYDEGTIARTGADGHTPRVDRDAPRTVLITGVSRGLGRALATRLMELGHTIIGCARSEDTVHELRQQWGPPHRFDVVDVASDTQVQNWAASVIAERPAPDLVINNAAGGHRQTQIWRLSPDEFADVINVNLYGTVNVLRHFVPGMLRRKTGVIVNYSSGWGRETAATVGAYCASKWAIEGLTRVLAQELPPGMAAVSLHPGIIDTDALRLTFGDEAGDYPSPAEWVDVAAPYILTIGPQDNGKALSVPGMTTYRGARPKEIHGG